MSIVKIKIEFFITQSDKAVLVRYKNQDIWIPKSVITKAQGKNINLYKSWIDKKKLTGYKNIMNQPSRIEPVPNQKPINDLIYNKDGS